MAQRPLRPCNHPGCRELVQYGRCEKHRKQEQSRYNKERGSAWSQGYDADWNKCREAFLGQHPLCEPCRIKGILVPATIAHHKIEVKDGGARLDFENLMATCHACHEEVHGKDRFKRTV